MQWRKKLERTDRGDRGSRFGIMPRVRHDGSTVEVIFGAT